MESFHSALILHRGFSFRDRQMAEYILYMLGLSQAQFSEKYGVSLDAVQNWEQGRRVPERSARILLTIVDRHPDFVEARTVKIFMRRGRSST